MTNGYLWLQVQFACIKYYIVTVLHGIWTTLNKKYNNLFTRKSHTLLQKEMSIMYTSQCKISIHHVNEMQMY